MKTRSTVGSALLRLTAAALCALAPAPCGLAAAAQPPSVPASAAQAARGVEGYEVGVSALEAGDVWVCQVVGVPVAAGSITLIPASGGVQLEARHSDSGDHLSVILGDDGTTFIVRGGVQVAAHFPPPAVGLPGTTVGGEALPQSPAWRLLAGAFADPNLQTALASASGGTGACRAACDASVAVPSRCTGPEVDQICCEKLARLRRCYAYCDCDASPSNSAACRLAADATWALAVTACSGLFGDPMEP